MSSSHQLVPPNQDFLLPLYEWPEWVVNFAKIPTDIQQDIIAEVLHDELVQYCEVRHGHLVQRAELMSGMMAEPSGYMRREAEELHIKNAVLWASLDVEDCEQGARQRKMNMLKRLDNFRVEGSLTNFKLILTVYFDDIDPSDPQPSLDLLVMLAQIFYSIEVLYTLPLCKLDHTGSPEDKQWIAVVPVINRVRAMHTPGLDVGPFSKVEEDLLELVREVAYVGRHAARWVPPANVDLQLEVWTAMNSIMG